MSRFTLPMITLLVGLFLLPMDAEARRFGGGMTGGKSFSAPQRQASPPAQRQQQRQDGAQNQQAARPGMGGLMGGLLAGGLLAALFMGGAFDGIQLMDVLLIAGVGFLIFKFLKSLRGGAANPRAAYAGPGSSAAFGDGQAQTSMSRSGFMPEPPVSGLATGYMMEPLNLPEWFDQDAFLEAAGKHFTHLQRVWDQQDWEEIATYTSDEMLTLLQQERAGLAHDQHTEVVSVMAELVNFIDKGDRVIASVNFYGWLREEDRGDTTEFSEIWHLERSMQEQSGNWIIVGIEQPA
ncbi:Tim44 domain-containing protein [Nitrincola sp.]|uniref:Tim44 domain-containing protein n=1 Tax=Nitrincola sp. TaxID=1926584 RepID=UPI003A9190DA